MKHNWTYKKLGEVATLTGGFTPKADELFSEGKYPYFKVSDMNTAGNEVVLTKTPSFVVDSKKCYPQGAIVFPKNGAAVSTNKKRILGQDSIVDLNTCAAILNSDIDIKFAYYWFYNLDFKTLVRGGALPTLDLKGLRSLQFPIPSLDEQQAIVRELDGINYLIDLQEEQLREYDRLAQSLFYTTFGDPVSNPKGWEVKKLGEVATSELGKTLNQSKDTGVLRPYLCAINILWGEINIKTLKEARFGDSEVERYSVRKGDLLVCEGGETGRAAIWKDDEPMLYQNALHRVRFENSIVNTYALFWLQMLKQKGEIDAKYSKGVTIKHLVKSALLSIPIMCPPLALQQTFAAQIEAIEQQKALIRRSLEDTRTLLAARMQYYFE